MNRFGYQEILLRYLWPFILKKFGGRAYVHQDNDPKHTSRLCMNTCFRFGINLVQAPAQSPDLNPVRFLD